MRVRPVSGVVASVLSVVVALCASEGVAEASPRARLVYARGAAADACPDETALRRAVAARVGYDPFFPWAEQTVVVSIASRGSRLAARFELVDDAARSQGAHEIESSGADCTELFQSIALAIAIAIDPHALVAPEAERQPAPEVAPSPAVNEAVEPSPSPPNVDRAPGPPDEPASATELRAYVVPRASVGLEPAPSAGLFVGSTLAWRHVALGVELGSYLPSSVDVSAGGRATGWLLAGSLVPCLRSGVLYACGVVSVGRFEGSATGVASPMTRAEPFVAAGARAAIALPLSARIDLVVDADLLGNLHRAALQVGSDDVWRAPLAAASLGAGVAMRF